MLPYPAWNAARTAFYWWQGVRRKNLWFEREHRREFFRRAFYAISFNGIEGDYAEFGCHGGLTFHLAYESAQRVRSAAKLWAFDSFSGLPPASDARDDHPRWQPGILRTGVDDFHRICARHGIPRNRYEVVPGYYDETLRPEDTSVGPRRISLAYIDCDMYTSTRSVLQYLLPRLQHGMIIGFDDYYCWSRNQLSGERRAWLEAFSHHEQWVMSPYVQFGWAGMSFVVEDRALVRNATDEHSLAACEVSR